MIVDSSALLAMVFDEKQLLERITSAIAEARNIGIGAPTLTETGTVLAARIGQDAEEVIAHLVEGLDLAVIPFTAAHGREARQSIPSLRQRDSTAPD